MELRKIIFWVVLAAGGLWLLYYLLKNQRRIVNFLSDVKSEMKKVSWSSREELIASTWIVLTTTAILAVFIGLLDATFAKLITKIIK
jgi:preprotein translocase subunit SecE